MGSKITFNFSQAGLAEYILLFLGGVLGLLLSRMDILAMLIFSVCYLLLVYRTYLNKSLFGLALSGLLSALILSLRFKYLTWGDPWSEYAMILKIMKSGMLTPAYYPDQEPALHTLIAAASHYVQVGAMPLQKYIVPAFSSLSLLALYGIAREFFDEETALASALLLSVGTAYIHWATQAVTESLGIPLALIALYLSYRAIMNAGHLPACCTIIAGLVLTHHLSTLIFIIWYNSFALAHLYFRSENRIEALRGLFISVFSLALALGWWSARLPTIYGIVTGSMGRILHSDSPVIASIIILIIVYSVPVLLAAGLIRLRSRAARLQSFRSAAYLGIIFFSLASSLLALHFLLGRSFFVLSYPVLFFANGLMMLLFALVGMRGFLYLDRMPVIAWMGGVAALFLGSILKLYSAEDPLRFIEFIYPPLSIIAACGFIFLTSRVCMGRMGKIGRIGSRRRAALMALICLSSLVVAFPSTVFWGQDYPPGDARHDARALVISHPESEIMAIDHLKVFNALGKLHTDRYVGYASLPLENISSDFSIALLENGRAEVYGRQQMNPDFFSGDSNFVIITSRMGRYAEFGEWLLQEKSPLSGDERAHIEKMTSMIYDNGGAQIYKASPASMLSASYGFRARGSGGQST